MLRSQLSALCKWREMVLPSLTRSSRQFAGLNLIYITPHPCLSRPDGAHKRMLGFVKVLGSVLVLRRVAAADMATDQAHAQVYPRVAGLNAVLTLDLVEVSAFLGHEFLRWFTNERDQPIIPP